MLHKINKIIVMGKQAVVYLVVVSTLGKRMNHWLLILIDLSLMRGISIIILKIISLVFQVYIERFKKHQKMRIIARY